MSNTLATLLVILITVLVLWVAGCSTIRAKNTTDRDFRLTAVVGR